VDQLGKLLRLVIRHGLGDEPLPDRFGEVVQSGQRARVNNRVCHLL
jgi:hypothetical protein